MATNSTTKKSWAICRKDMIEIDIPSIDPIQHEPKIFFGMTSRQCLIITPAAALGGIMFWLTHGISMEVAMGACIACVAPAILFGWYKPYNMRFEAYLKLIYYNEFISSPKRIYKTDSEEERKFLTQEERAKKEKKEFEKIRAEEKKKKAKESADLKEQAKLSKKKK